MPCRLKEKKLTSSSDSLFYSIERDQSYCHTHIKYSILLLFLLLLGVLDPPGQVIDQDELDEGGVDEEHADPVPQIHGGKVRNNRQLGTKSERKGIIFSLLQDSATVHIGLY